MGGGIDGICHRRYSLPIQRHLVACANTEVLHIGRDPVRFASQSANICPTIPPITPVQSSNQQTLSAHEAGPLEAI
jgi:hypothetical protein